MPPFNYLYDLEILVEVIVVEVESTLKYLLTIALVHPILLYVSFSFFTHLKSFSLSRSHDDFFKHQRYQLIHGTLYRWDRCNGKTGTGFSSC